MKARFCILVALAVTALAVPRVTHAASPPALEVAKLHNGTLTIHPHYIVFRNSRTGKQSRWSIKSYCIESADCGVLYVLVFSNFPGGQGMVESIYAEENPCTPACYDSPSRNWRYIAGARAAFPKHFVTHFKTG